MKNGPARVVSACLGTVLVLVKLALGRARLVVASDQDHLFSNITSQINAQRREETNDSHLHSFFGTLTDTVKHRMKETLSLSHSLYVSTLYEKIREAINQLFARFSWHPYFVSDHRRQM